MKSYKRKVSHMKSFLRNMRLRELLEVELPEEHVLNERLHHEDGHEEDSPDENVPDDEHSEEDVSEYGLDNLTFAKMMKFKGHYFEMRLVSFLLRIAIGLKKLLLVPPEGNHMEAPGEDLLDTSLFLETVQSFEKASPDAQIVLSNSGSAAIQPLHSDVLASDLFFLLTELVQRFVFHQLK